MAVMTPRIPAVSVLMTAYNRERYIAAAIESVLAQTFHDFELVIVDDHSTDATVGIAAGYAARDRRVRVVVNDNNLGDYPNRNRAASLAHGRFLKYHDSDDIMYPHCLEIMVSALEAVPRAEFALTTSRPWAGGPCPMLLTPRMCYEREYLGEGMFHGGPACGLFRREAFERLGMFPLRGPTSDYHFWVEACRRANVLLVQGDLFFYRVHEEQSMRDVAAQRQQLLQIERTAWGALFDRRCPLDGEALEQARRNRLTGMVRRALRDVLNGDWRTGIARFRAVPVQAQYWLKYFRGRHVDPTAGTPAPEPLAQLRLHP
jgi:glycosyltransferase involved in cell wall biosynthesis